MGLMSEDLYEEEKEESWWHNIHAGKRLYQLTNLIMKTNSKRAAERRRTRSIQNSAKKAREEAKEMLAQMERNKKRKRESREEKREKEQLER